ncbi:MAG: hypothetical protein V2I97_08395, partial [Desulfococcaceae bacterium]|nr:hypothetical protein [Desulfococcaceae bacterium]
MAIQQYIFHTVNGGNKKMREVILERLKKDLIGPYEDNEILQSRPSDVYLTGILWPSETRMGAEEDEKLGLSGQDEFETSSEGEEEEISLTGLMRPCSAGLSFAAAAAADGKPELNVMVQFATYEIIDPTDVVTNIEDNMSFSAKPVWRRRPYNIQISNILLSDASRFINLTESGAPPDVKIHIRSVDWSEGKIATVTLLNRAVPSSDEGRNGVEKLTLFQVRLEIQPSKNTFLVARPSRRAVVDEDDQSSELLYRNVHEFAVGHTCSAEWEENPETLTASKISTSWIPSVKVLSTNPSGHEVFNSLRTTSGIQPLSAFWLSGAVPENLSEALEKLPSAYMEWIERQELNLIDLSGKYQEQARNNINICRTVQNRMADGVQSILQNAEVMKAFQLANLAMSLQHDWDTEKRNRGKLEWRPFQLGFILLAASSIVEKNHPDRSIMDLLWFPTGGGKTEAYLFLIAFLAFYRRLSHKNESEKGAGVAAIMRYTLRLLTTQQFSRAASVILACEAIRRDKIPVAGDVRKLGNIPFSIGLWVGNEAVPNKIEDAAGALSGSPDQPTPKQLLNCPACGEKLYWFHNEKANAIHVRCEKKNCILYHPEVPLPVWTVDEDVYREKPTLLIGTIDKFAQIVRRKDINALFGLDVAQPPDLIIQDELHLISGPLGTVSGLYEAALDRMFSVGGSCPKIIGSTATIRRASDQVKNL